MSLNKILDMLPALNDAELRSLNREVIESIRELQREATRDFYPGQMVKISVPASARKGAGVYDGVVGTITKVNQKTIRVDCRMPGVPGARSVSFPGSWLEEFKTPARRGAPLKMTNGSRIVKKTRA